MLSKKVIIFAYWISVDGKQQEAHRRMIARGSERASHQGIYCRSIFSQIKIVLLDGRETKLIYELRLRCTAHGVRNLISKHNSEIITMSRGRGRDYLSSS